MLCLQSCFMALLGRYEYMGVRAGVPVSGAAMRWWPNDWPAEGIVRVLY